MNRICLRLVLLLGLGSLLATGPAARAAVPPEKKQELDRQLDAELQKILDQLVSDELLAARMGFKLPILEPKQPLANVERLAERQLEEVARKKWPDTWVDTELAKLRPNWRQWEVGDSVTVVTKEGAQFTERLREINEFQIQVGPNWYRKDDLSAACRQHVDAAFARKTEADERAKLEKQLLANRQTSMRESRLDTIRTLYLEHGYMMIAGKWTSKFEYFGRIRQEERERLAAHLRGPLEYKVYYQTGGFREFKGEWYTPEEAAKLREQERIENELRPEEFIAELDDLNRESLVLLATPAGGDDGAGLFDDDAPGKKPAPAPGKADPNAKTPSPAHATKAPTP